MKQVYIIDAIRTPVGKYGGALSSIRPDDLLAHVIKALINRNASIDVDAIEDVIAGDANQAGEDNRNVARMAALLAGLPVSVAGNTVNRLCASGLQAIMDASRAIMCDEGDCYIAGGVESKTRPFVMGKSSNAWNRQHKFLTPQLVGDSSIRNSPKNFILIQWEKRQRMLRSSGRISREEQDQFALGSQENISRHWKKGNGRMKSSGSKFLEERRRKYILKMTNIPGKPPCRNWRRSNQHLQKMEV
jgi:acetyl-CoA acetyltransferase